MAKETVNCIKCNAEISGNEFSICGNNFSICTNCKREKNTNKYKYIAIIILILGFIDGIIMGNIYKHSSLIYKSDLNPAFNEYEYTFNTALMFYSWLASALLSLFIFAIHSICHRLDLIIDKKK